MKIITQGNVDLYISKECYLEILKRLGNNTIEYTYKFIREDIEDFMKKFRKSKFFEFLDIYGKQKNLEGYAILDAHGFNQNQEWFYRDNNKKKIQSWIKNVDGKYAGLILNVCNPLGKTPESKKSPLVLPYIDSHNYLGNGILYSILNAGFVNSISHPIENTNIILPNGEEINNYTIDYDLERIKSESEFY